MGWVQETAATSMTLAPQAWNQWCDMTGSSLSCSATATVWLSWCNTGTGLYGLSRVTPTLTHSPTPSAPETEEQRCAREERARVAAVESKKRVEQMRLRAARAKALLEEALDRKQRAEFRKHGYFHVQTADGERAYRLRPGSSPLRVKSDDGFGYSYCIHPVGNYAAEDTVLALKLLLETDEEAFLRIANASIGHHLVNA
jgi:hypothetical protein